MAEPGLGFSRFYCSFPRSLGSVVETDSVGVAHFIFLLFSLCYLISLTTICYVLDSGSCCPLPGPILSSWPPGSCFVWCGCSQTGPLLLIAFFPPVLLTDTSSSQASSLTTLSKTVSPGNQSFFTHPITHLCPSCVC